MTNNAPRLTSQTNNSSALKKNALHAPPSLPNDILNFSRDKLDLLIANLELTGTTPLEVTRASSSINILNLAIQDYQTNPSTSNSQHMNDTANTLLYGGIIPPALPFEGLIEIIDRRVTYNPDVPSFLRSQFGVRTTIIPANSVNTFSVNDEVIFGLRPSLPQTITVDFFSHLTPELKRKPMGMRGAFFRFFMGEDEPLTPKENITSQILLTRTPSIVVLDEYKSGSKFWVTAAWVSRRGMLGKFSPFLRFYLP